MRDEIDYWEMSDYISLPIRKYSLGMKQRIGDCHVFPQSGEMLAHG